MALNSKITITNPNVNSGTAISLNSEGISTSWEMFTSAVDTPRRTVGADYTTALGSVISTGLSNPRHTVKGVVDLKATHTTGALAKMDTEFILELINNCDQELTLTADKFITSTNLTGTRTVMLKGYSDSGANMTGYTFSMVFIELEGS